MTANLEGKVIAITGGGSGLGRAASRLAAQGGASLVLGDLSKEGLDTSADAILSDGGSKYRRWRWTSAIPPTASD